MARFRKNDFFKWAQKIKSVFCFIPHTHEGCDLLPWSRCLCRRSFNPHTHEGCDTWKMKTTPRLTVSIHTPTKGVTWWQLVNDAPVGVSIHTPTKGVTDPHMTHKSRYQVSIHTPTKGVTYDITEIKHIIISFNPHTHEGCDFVIILC